MYPSIGPPEARRIQDPKDKNVNNLSPESGTNDSAKPEWTLASLVKLIAIAVDCINNDKGVTMRDIRKALINAELISESMDLRKAMVKALKRGVITRSDAAVKTGHYGLYVRGDNIPVFLGKGPGCPSCGRKARSKVKSRRERRNVGRKRGEKRRQRTKKVKTSWVGDTGDAGDEGRWRFYREEKVI